MSVNQFYFIFYYFLLLSVHSVFLSIEEAGSSPENEERNAAFCCDRSDRQTE